MSFFKRGESFQIKQSDIQSFESVQPMIDESIVAEMKSYVETIKTASVEGGKRIAPKANDFLYFAAVMMHAAESAIINDDGTPKFTRTGKIVEAHWDTSNDTWRWVCSDPSIKALKNANGDIFPEAELKKAYKKWVGKPLCIDHKSSSVDHVRGFIVDTYYDTKLKRVIGLCALDRKNYPDLARKVETGYSNSVSMGTAVANAVCYDCGTVAKTEHDFCNHMRTKSGYGEINIGLSPMELSIVVNGADPKAKIKEVLAAANTLNSYVNDKAKQLESLAENYTAQLNFDPNKIPDNATNPDGTSIDRQTAQMNLNSSSLEEFRKNINEAIDNFKKLQESGNNDELNYADNQSSGTYAMQKTELPMTDYSNAPPHARFASDENEELKELKLSIEAKLNKMQEDLTKLAGLTNQKEETMSNINKQGFYQGGGEGNEPTPGQKKYPVDPLQDKLRDKEDRQMVGQKPFPGVGNVDEMYPGNDSTPTSNELERKKMLARAEVDDRAQRRLAALAKAKDIAKEAYIQNGQDASNGNTPTPGKVKYKPDPLQDKLRDKEDRQMVGQKPFPGVGDVDGMHPSPDSVSQRDELKRKELLLRAGLRGRFVKASNEDGTLDRGNSAWEVFRGDELVLSKTVDELTQGNADNLYSGVATEAFGKDLINKIKSFGAKAVDGLFKSAQATPSPALPAPEETSAPKEESDSASLQDPGKEGDPKETANELADQVRDLSSDLAEVVHQLTGEQTEMGGMGEAPALPLAADDGKSTTASLNSMRKDLNAALIVSLKESIAELNDHEHELNTVVYLYEKGAVNDTNKDYVGTIVNDSISEAKTSLASAFKLLGGAIKFAHATNAIEKRAKVAEREKFAHGDNMDNKEIMDLLGQTGSELDDLDTSFEDDDSLEHADETDLLHDLLSDDLKAMDDNDAVITSNPDKAVELAKKDPSVPVELKTASSKESRQLLRTKLASEVKWNPMMSEFHKHVEDPSFDVKPSGDLGHVETIDEIHDAMMDVATTSASVRKTAEEIQELVSKGELNVKDLDLLVSNGVDPAAVKYWRDLYGEAGPEGKSFAAEMVKTHAKAQAEEDMNTYRVKIARSYELANQMASVGAIPNNRNSISAQVDEIMKWNDAGFESMKKVMAQHASVSMPKTAGRLPQVGLYTEEATSSNKSDLELFAEAFASKRPRSMF